METGVSGEARRLGVFIEKPKGIGRALSISMWQAVLVLGVLWLAYAMKDPNYRWMIVDDNVMRVRNGLFIAVLAIAFIAIQSYRRTAVGRAPIFVAEFGLDGELEIRQPAVFLVSRGKSMEVSDQVAVVFTELPQVKLWPDTVYVRTLEFKARGTSLKNGMFWDLDRSSLEALLLGLKEAGVAVDYSSRVSTQTNSRRELRRRARARRRRGRP